MLTPGQIKDLEGGEMTGEILLMDLMYVQGLEPRYFVLFPTTILLLSYNDQRDNSWTYRGRIHVPGITVVTHSNQNVLAFQLAGQFFCQSAEISTHCNRCQLSNYRIIDFPGPTLHPISVLCPDAKVKESWMSRLKQLISNNNINTRQVGLRQINI